MNAHVSVVDATRTQPTTVCRAIEERDVPGIVALLAEGFPRRSRRFWKRALAALAQRPQCADYVRFGYLLEDAGMIVGCLLLIVSEHLADGVLVPRGNVSSWYVRPGYRFQASMLASRVFRLKQLTLLNISPAPHTVPILEAQGYRRYVAGQFMSLSFLSPRGAGMRVVRLRADDRRFDYLPEIDLLRRHDRFGCICLLCIDGERIEPFIVRRRRILKTIVPAVQLVWCRDTASFLDCAGALGRHLLRRGVPVISCDAAGPIVDLPGVFRDGNTPKYFRGPRTPRFGDLADTELAILGI